MSGRGDDGSWSRAYMAGSGLALGARRAARSPDLNLASGATLPRAKVAQLSQHRDPEVREAVARRDDCPFGVLAALAHDTRPLVRIAVASHPRAGRTVLEHLARDRDPHVLKAVARNSTTPLDIVAALAGHRREEVRHAADRAMSEREDAIRAGASRPHEGASGQTAGAVIALHGAAAAVAAASHPMRRVTPHMLAPRPAVGRRPVPRAERGAGSEQPRTA